MTAGSIVRLKLEHFMTYDFMEITPCPGLNLITGPNGTGKSSLLCAMCLGLAGKPSSIGRSERISDFIKNGYDQATIEIELLNPDERNLVIGRVINLSNTSSWTLNGKAVPQKVVEREIAKFNIQTNNLCQFLPQEKVADFAKMNQRELLESTEQAVGDQSMFDNHTKLKELRLQYCELECGLNHMKENLERQVEKNKRLEGEIKQHKEREKHVKKLKSLEKKILWKKHDKLRIEYFAKRKEVEQLTKELKKNRDNLGPMKKNIAQLGQQHLQITKAIESQDQEIWKTKQQVSAAGHKLEDLDSKVADLKYEVNDKIKEERNRGEKIEGLVAHLRAREVEYLEAKAEEAENIRQLEMISTEMKEVHHRQLQAASGMRDSEMQQTQLTHSVREVEYSLERLRSHKEHRYSILRKQEPDVYQAILWLRQNEHLFKKKIYEPILTLINVLKPESVKYIENHIAYRDLTAFFAEDPDDMNKFLRILSDEKGLAISGIHSVPVPESQLQPRLSKAMISKYGLTEYLKELFTAPPPVMNYLCKSYGLHEVPVGFAYDKTCMNHILAVKDFPFRKFYLGDFVYRLKTSKYGTHTKSSTSQKIVDGGLITGSVDSDAIDMQEKNKQALADDLRKQKEAHKSFAENERNCSVVLERLRGQKKMLMDKRDSLKNLVAKINSVKERIKSAEIPLCNIEEETRRLMCFVNDSIQEKIKILGQLKLLYKVLFSVEKEKSVKTFAHYFTVKMKDELEKALRNGTTEIHRLEQSLIDVKSTVERMKSELNKARSIAMKSSGWSGDVITDAMKEQMNEEFSGLPDDINELNREVCRQQAKLNCIFTTNPAVIEEYVNREKYIIQTKDAVRKKETDLKVLEENINNTRDSWLPAIEALIERISTNFSQYFASLGCAGEVTLDKTENPNDFHKYGLCIKVKFRDDEPLNQLNHAHHSGGECSVSTILFILSLQELTEVPFRCVDEINQGMDNINERSIFVLIVKSSCSKKKSQYFLITPKLLPGLEYPSEMQIAIIHNGSSKKFQWNISKYLKRRSSLSS